jgi:hypothetical protein
VLVDGDGELVAGEVGAAVGFARASPLSQVSFLPDFMQTYFLPETTEVVPALEQVDPAFAAPYAGKESDPPKKASETRRVSGFFIAKMLPSLIYFVSTPSPQFFSSHSLVSSPDIASA